MKKQAAMRVEKERDQKIWGKDSEKSSTIQMNDSAKPNDQSVNEISVDTCGPLLEATEDLRRSSRWSF
uniref:Uncharacterized protein n=1 Tax=Acrobeloides nanus TaxID=290746 RepID=A0A914E275_9BILA